jgi:uncharacterized protein (TIGR03085 family)
MSSKTVAQRERAALADLFDAVGPDQPTLDEGWLTADLLHHLIVRERRPDTSLARAIGPLNFWADRVIAGYAKLPWSARVELFRSGPQRFSPFRIEAVDNAFNAGEFFIHHEDVRRGRPGWTPRELDAETTAVLTKMVRSRFVTLSLKRLNVGIRAQLPDGTQFELVPGDPGITIVGAVGELTLWTSGRRTACDVEVLGGPQAIKTIEEAGQR